MFSWSGKRRIVYMAGFILVLVLIVGTYLSIKLYDAPTCSDGLQNQDELGIDCGGNSCQFLCSFQVTEPTLLFSRSFEVVPGIYNAVAYVENPNFDAGVKNVSYRFRLLDKENNLIATREGSTFITPGNISPIFESAIDTGGIVPVRTFFEFQEELKWTKVTTGEEKNLSIENRVLKNTDTKPRLNAILKNDSVFDIRDVEIVSVIFNGLGNAVATSRTFFDIVPERSETNLVFTWPQPFEKLLEACVVPVQTMLIIDISGSMNDDGQDPPQPLTDAKNAAADFITRLGDIDRSGLISFGTTARVNQPLTPTHIFTREAIYSLVIPPEEEVGSTNTGEALRVVREGFLTRFGNEADRRIAILLTDGKANAPDEPGGEEYAEEHALKVKNDGIILYTIGLGDNVNETFLRSLADSPLHYYQAATSRDLGSIYRSISDAICERSPAILDIIPRTKSTLY